MNIWDLMFGGQQTVGMVINLLIFALFAIGILDVVRGLLRLRMESRWVKNAGTRLRDANESDPPGMIPTESPAALTEFLSVPPQSLLGHRISRALQLRNSGLGSREVLQLVTSERLGSYGALARHIGATLTLLGLLGTVVGLSIALMHIGSASDIKGVEDLGRLSQALGQTMGGMKTAFGCTLAGLLTAVLLSFLNYGLRRVQSTVLRSIEEFTACELLRTLQRVDPESDNATKAFATVLSEVSKDMVDLGAHLEDAASEYRSGADVVEDSLEKLVKTVDAFSTTIDRVAGNEVDFAKTMSATRTAIEGVGTVVQQCADVVRDGMAQARQSSVETSELQSALLSHYQEFKRLADSIKVMHSDTLKAALSGLEAANKAAVGDVLQQHNRQLAAILDQNQKSIQGIVEQNRTTMLNVAELLLDVRLTKQADGHAVAVGGMN